MKANPNRKLVFLQRAFNKYKQRNQPSLTKFESGSSWASVGRPSAFLNHPLAFDKRHADCRSWATNASGLLGPPPRFGIGVWTTNRYGDGVFPAIFTITKNQA